MTSTKITLGRIGEPFGVKGWVHVHSFTDPAENIFHYPHWQIRAYQKRDAVWRLIEIESHKPHGSNAFIVKFKNCDDRDQALLLKNHTIGTDREELPALKENEYYWSDLIGLDVVNTQGESFGVVDYLFETGANDIIATKPKSEAPAEAGARFASRNKTHYIPYIKSVIKSVDLDKKIITVEWEALE